MSTLMSVKNLKPNLASNWFWIGTFVLLNLLDYITTLVGLSLGLYEINPIGQLIGVTGVAGAVAKIVGCPLLITPLLLFNHQDARDALKALSLLLLASVGLNAYAIASGSSLISSEVIRYLFCIGVPITTLLLIRMGRRLIGTSERAVNGARQ